MADTRTEYAVRTTWTDGHSEINPHDFRRLAEIQVRNINDPKNGTLASATAVLVSRQVTVGDWAEV